MTRHESLLNMSGLIDTFDRELRLFLIKDLRFILSFCNGAASHG